MKKIYVSIFAIFLLASVLYALSYDNKEPEADSLSEYKTVDVAQGELIVKISATGVVEPNFQVEVKSKASGEVLSFPYEEGDFIKKGKLLLRLDKSNELRNVARAENNLQSTLAQLKKSKTALLIQKTKHGYDLQTSQSGIKAARANLKEAEHKLKRQIDLFAKRIISQESLDRAKTSYKVKQEELVQARAHYHAAADARHDITLREDEIRLANVEVARSQITVEEARERLQETEIFAPIDGVIIKKMVEEGQIISSGITSVSGGTELCLIADVSRLFIVADVDETDIGSIKSGQEVIISADAFPVEMFRGKVKRIAPQGEDDDNITIFKVKIEIMGGGKIALKPMMTANVDIISHREKNALYVPHEVINKKDGQMFALLLAGNQPEKILVTTGVQTPIHIQILSGIEKDQKLIVGDWQEILGEKEKPKDGKSTLRKILWMLRFK